VAQRFQRCGKVRKKMRALAPEVPQRLKQIVMLPVLRALRGDMRKFRKKALRFYSHDVWQT
jgi:hypothetical protein